MASVFDIQTYPIDPSFIAHERKYCLVWYDENHTLYMKIQTKNRNKPVFKFFCGPPFVSGKLHLGHIAVSSIKSMIYNYRSMKGFNCEFKLGYDTHGFPIEALVAKENKLDTVEKIKELGLANFNAICDETVTRYSNSWTPLIQQMGRLANFEDPYYTRSLEFMESCIWTFKEMYDQGLVYKGNKVMPYSLSLRSPLSNFEAKQNYQTKITLSVYVGFQLIDDSKTFLVAWTSAVWTLPMNLALCVNANLDYVKIQLANSDKFYILGKESIINAFGKKQKYTVLAEMKGSELAGMRYQPLFPYLNDVKSAYHVLVDNYVTVDTIGTSIVHLSPAFGKDDFRVCAANNIVNNVNISDYCTIDDGGNYTDVVSDYKGRFIFDCENQIRRDIKNNLTKTEEYKHEYPYCYRTNTLLIYRTCVAYFIKVTTLKDRMSELNQTVNWYPKEAGDRFQQWLENAEDWCVSRDRFYGTPMPIWVAEDGESICVGSIAELEALTGAKIDNLHPEFVNDLIINRNGKEFKRVKYIFDCWFESGNMPIGQNHHPFKPNSGLESRKFLSDFVVEGIDQTRGWFYTLFVISVALFDKPPFENVLCTGLVLDEKGKKISKSAGNFVDPTLILNEYGTDMIRVYFIKSPLIYANPLKFDIKGIEELRKHFPPLTNAVKFLLENIIHRNKQLGTSMISELKSSDNLTDKWIVTLTAKLVTGVTLYIEQYQFNLAVNLLISFIDDLTNWYVNINRDRIKGLKGNEERETSINILYNVLMINCRLWAPFTPFLSEHIYQCLKPCSLQYSEIESVLLTDYPEELKSDMITDCNLMSDLQQITTMVLRLRANTPKHTRRVVPLKCCTIYHHDVNYLKSLEKHMSLIHSKTNCLEYKFQPLEGSYSIKIEPNRQTIGKEYKKEAGKFTKFMESRTKEFLVQLYSKTVELEYDGKIVSENFYTLHRVPEEVKDVNVISAIEGNIMISINTTYDEELDFAYQMRRLFSEIQKIRKKLQLHLWNPVTVTLDSAYATEGVKLLLEKNNITVVIEHFDEIFTDDQIGPTVTDEFRLYKDRFVWNGFNSQDICGNLVVFNSLV